MFRVNIFPSPPSKPEIGQVGQVLSSKQVLHIHVLSIGDGSESRKRRKGVVTRVAI